MQPLYTYNQVSTVNDQIGGQSITITLCPLTGTGMVFNTTDEDGSQIELGVSGLLINSNLVMYDRRDGTTLYPQMLYTGITGTYKNEQLELLPVVETTWAMWKKMYPDSKAAQFGTGLERYPASRQSRYNSLSLFLSYPYGNYQTNNGSLIFFPTTGELNLTFDLEAEEGTSHIKEIVLGICHNDEVKAYPFLTMPAQAVINDEVGGLPLVVVFDKNTSLALPFHREVDGQVLNFYGVAPEGDLPLEFMDVETGTRWNLRGEAVSGPLAGQRLQQKPAYNSMWFAWAVYWSETDIWLGEGIIDPPPTAVEEEGFAALPQHFVLEQNYPNPFNPSTHIQYTLPQAGPVRLDVYNGAGQKIRSLVEGYREQGLYLQNWDGRDDAGATVASGVYLYRLEMPGLDLVQTRNMTLLH